MDEYVKKQNVIEAIKPMAGVGNRIIDRIRNLPEEDVANVVRCKDCDKYIQAFSGFCTQHKKEFGGYQFCSYGERKTE